MKARNTMTTLITRAGTQFLVVLALILASVLSHLDSRPPVPLQVRSKINKAQWSTRPRESNQPGYWFLPIGAGKRLWEYRIDYLPVGRYTVEAKAPVLSALCKRI